MPYAVLTALIAIISVSTLGSDFLSIDDSMLIIHNPLMSFTWANIQSIFTWPMDQFYDASYYPGQMKFVYYRPLLLIYYLLNTVIWGLNPVGFHVLNLLLHLLTTFLVFRIAMLLFDNNRAAALLAAAFFSVHPVHNEIIGRVAMNENLLGLTMAASLYLWLQRRRRLSMFMFAFALLTKESAIMLPFIIFTFELNDKRLKDAVVKVIPYASITLLFLIVRATIVYAPDIQLLNGNFPVFILKSCAAMAAYLKLLLVPIDLSIYYPSWSYDKQTAGNLLLTGFILMTVIWALWRWRREPTIRVFMLCPIILLLPVIINANNLILGFNKAFVAERQLYVPSIFFALFIASLVRRYDDMLTGKIICAVILVAIPLFAYKLSTFSTVWISDKSVYSVFKRDYPETFLARKTKAAELYGQGDLDGALAAYQALLRPSTAGGHVPRGQSIVVPGGKNQDLGSALAGYQVWFADLHYDIGLILMGKNDLDAAIRKFRVALLLQPYFYGARVSLARVYMAQRRYRDAAREYAFARKEISLIHRDDI